MSVLTLDGIVTRYSPTERIGINAVEQAVLRELKWIFREQPIADMGIDAHIEHVEEGRPTGRLIGVQVKTGTGNFSILADALVYYGSNVHLDYWTGHSLPVILVAHLPEEVSTYWAVVSLETIQRTEKGWKLIIPKSNVLGKESKERLARLFAGTEAQQRQRMLAIHEPLMRHVQRGLKVSVELEDWINKSLGRTPVTVFTYDEDGTESPALEWYQLYVGYSTKLLSETLFPWAEVRVDDDFYSEHAEIPRHLSGYEPEAVESDEAYPYKEAAGEVEYYRLELRLNELGKAFLKVSDFLAGNHGIRPAEET